MALAHCEDARQRGRTLQGQRVNIVDVSHPVIDVVLLKMAL